MQQFKHCPNCGGKPSKDFLGNSLFMKIVQCPKCNTKYCYLCGEYYCPKCGSEEKASKVGECWSD